MRIDGRGRTDDRVDVVARLQAAHDRIRAVLSDAVALAESGAEEGPASGGPRSIAAREVLQHLTVDMSLHEADEDASIAPRLGAAARTFEGVIERVEEHGPIDAMVADLAADWRRMWIEGAPPIDLARHRASVARLREVLEAHLALEEREIFPRVAALAQSERREILLEMDERRR